MKRTQMIIRLQIVILIAFVLSACSFGNTQVYTKNQERVLRIATTEGLGEDDEYFRMQYTNIFEYNHPGIEIEIINTQINKDNLDPLDALLQLMESDQPPDVVMMNYDQLPELIDRNMLVPLSNRLDETKLIDKGYSSTIYNGIRDLSTDGQVYALAPFFNASALIYNKQIFKDAGVESPQDNMTWEQIFTLAERISKQDSKIPTYGFAFSPQRRQDVFHSLDLYTAPMQLHYLNETADQMVVDTDSWEKVWKQIYELQHKGIIPPVYNSNHLNPYVEGLADQSPFPNDYFRMGLLGMTIISYDQLYRFMEMNEHADHIPNYTAIDWDIVTVPCHDAYANQVSHIEMIGLMAISAKAQNAEDAWKFIEFINSPEWSRIKSGNHDQLPVYQQYTQIPYGIDYNIEAFYKVKPCNFLEKNYAKLKRTTPGIEDALKEGQSEMRSMLLGEQTAREGLKAWQEQGNQILREMRTTSLITEANK